MRACLCMHCFCCLELIYTERTHMKKLKVMLYVSSCYIMHMYYICCSHSKVDIVIISLCIYSVYNNHVIRLQLYV